MPPGRDSQVPGGASQLAGRGDDAPLFVGEQTNIQNLWMLHAGAQHAPRWMHDRAGRTGSRATLLRERLPRELRSWTG